MGAEYWKGFVALKKERYIFMLESDEELDASGV